MPSGLFDILSVLGFGYPSANVSSGASYTFEQKDGKKALLLEISQSDKSSNIISSLVSFNSDKTVTTDNVKLLPGVTAAEEITVRMEVYTQSILGSRSSSVDVHFYNESATQQSSVSIPVSTSNEWVYINQKLTVPVGSTRMNIYFDIECGAGETLKTWFANLKITR